MRFNDVFKSDNDKMMMLKKKHKLLAVMKVEILNSPAYYLFIQLLKNQCINERVHFFPS